MYMQSCISSEVRYKFASNAYVANKAYEFSKLVDSGDFIDKAEIPLLTSQGNWEIHQVITVETEHKGLDCYICLPQNTDNTHVKICFTGVYDSLSAYRILNPLGAGYGEFQNEHPTLLAAIQDSIQDLENVTLEITGHSLGGADANNLLIYLLSDHLENNSFSNVSNIECTTFNAPGSNFDTAQLLQEKLIENSLAEEPIHITANIGYSEGDWVQQAGYQLYSDMPPELIDIHFIKQTIFEEPNDCFQDIYMMIADDISRIIGLPHKLDGGFFSPDEAFGDITFNNHSDYFTNQDQEGLEVINAELSIRSEWVSMIRDTLSWFFVGETPPISDTIHEPYIAQYHTQDVLDDYVPQVYDFDI